MRVPTGRREHRTARADLAELSRLGEEQRQEEVVTENVSARGVRLIADSFCPPGKRVVFRAAKDRLKLLARVVYCQAMENGKYAVGLELTPSQGAQKQESN